MLESAFQSKLLKALRSHPALREAVIWKLNADSTTKGMPDVMVSIMGKTTFLEIKCEPNVTTKIQSYYLRKLVPRSYVVTLTRQGAVQLINYSRPLDSCTMHFVTAVDGIAVRCVN